MIEGLAKRISIEDASLYNRFVLASFFMFIIPLLLAVYLIFMLITRREPGAFMGYARLIVFWMIASGIFGYIIIRRAITSVLSLIRKAKKISEGKFGEKIKVTHEDELKDLASAFNRITTELEHKIKELEYSRSLTKELFQKIGYAITSSQKMEALLTLMVQSIRKVLRAQAGFIAVYDHGGDKKLILKAYSGMQKDLSEGMEIPDNRGVIGFVIKGRKPVVIRKSETEPGGSVSSSEEDIINYNTILCVPIVEKNKTKGVMGVCDLADTEKIETEDLFLLENVANQIATAVENFELNKDIEETYYQTLVALARVVEAKDQYSAGHLERVSKHVELMADKLRLDHDTRKILIGGALLHDLGKVGIQDEILKKASSFSEGEYDVMKQHAIIGENILKPLRTMSKLSKIVRHHHEWYDGTGYPDGLKAEEIPLASRILTVADMYDAMTTDRPYRKALPREDAINTLRSYAGNKLDPKLVEVFISTL